MQVPRRSWLTAGQGLRAAREEQRAQRTPKLGAGGALLPSQGIALSEQEGAPRAPASDPSPAGTSRTSAAPGQSQRHPAALCQSPRAISSSLWTPAASPGLKSRSHPGAGTGPRAAPLPQGPAERSGLHPLYSGCKLLTADGSGAAASGDRAIFIAWGFLNVYTRPSHCPERGRGCGSVQRCPPVCGTALLNFQPNDCSG